MYAIVKVGGKQYRVESGDSIVVDRMSASEGDKVDLQPLLFRPDGHKDAVFEGGELEKVKVEATVTGHERGKKIHVLKYKPKRGYRRRSGARADLTRLAIGEIKQLSRRPAGSAKAADADAKPAAKKPVAAKGTAEKEPAAKKTPARKPAAKKPAAKRTTKKES
jgi:large subunit ribosomal protein L21